MYVLYNVRLIHFTLLLLKLRIICREGPEETFYYTTYDEFKFVLSKLDHEKYELILCEVCNYFNTFFIR